MQDLIGLKINRLTVISFSHKDKYHACFWNCICECGNKIIRQSSRLKNGSAKSCGCLEKERKTKHNLCQSPIYKTWNDMIQRCTNIKNNNYKNYGGRGIKICEKWLEFKGFYEDMGDKPEGLSLDRIDVNGNYCKDNCKWSTNIEQHNNMRRNVKVTYNGKTQTVSQWSRELGINSRTLHDRLFRANWDIENAFNKKLQKGRRP